MKFNRLINEIKLLNPFLWAEEKDAERWHNLCKQDLYDSYLQYLDSEKRLKKIKGKLEKLKRGKDDGNSKK